MIGYAETKLPAGILDGNTELFSQAGLEYAMHGGRTIEYDHFPEWLNEILDAFIIQDDILISALVEAEIVDKNEMRRQVIRCCFGVFDGEPDIVSGKLQATEYWNCPERGHCPYEGRICKAVRVNEFTHLTPKEIEVLTLIDLQAKEIADRLHIAESTVPTFKKNIFKKLGMNRQADVIKWALTKNLLQL